MKQRGTCSSKTTLTSCCSAFFFAVQWASHWRTVRVCVWGRGDTNRQVTVVIKLLFQTWVSSKGGPSLWNRGSGLVSNHHKGLSTRSKPHRWQLLLGDEKSHPAAEDINLRDPSSPTGTCGSSSLAPCGPPPYNWCLFHHPPWAFQCAPLMSWDLGSRGHGGLSACRGRQLGKLPRWRKTDWMRGEKYCIAS